MLNSGLQIINERQMPLFWYILLSNKVIPFFKIHLLVNFDCKQKHNSKIILKILLIYINGNQIKLIFIFILFLLGMYVFLLLNQSFEKLMQKYLKQVKKHMYKYMLLMFSFKETSMHLHCLFSLYYDKMYHKSYHIPKNQYCQMKFSHVPTKTSNCPLRGR